MWGRAAYMICRALAGSVSSADAFKYAASITSQAASRMETEKHCRVMARARFTRFDASFSSRLRCVAHLLVTALDGVDDGLSFQELNRDRRLAAVQIFDARTGNVQTKITGSSLETRCLIRMESSDCP